jgi:hypothetical protein
MRSSITYTLHQNIRIIRLSTRMRWAGYVAFMEARRNTYKILVGKPEGKRPLEKPRCIREYNIKMDYQGNGYINLHKRHVLQGSQGSSLSIVSNYGLNTEQPDDQG